MSHAITKASTHSADVMRLLKIFGLEDRQVTSLTFNARAVNFLTLQVECEISEDELRALVEELEANPPVQQSLDSLKYLPTTTESKT